jgi:hypothetical protein
MPKEPINGPEPTFSEDDIQREQLGPRGVPGVEDPAKMTPQREKKMPKNVDPGHPAWDCSNRVRRMWRLIPGWICGPDECLFDVAMDAGVAAVVALVVTESLRSLIESL